MPTTVITDEIAARLDGALGKGLYHLARHGTRWVVVIETAEWVEADNDFDAHDILHGLVDPILGQRHTEVIEMADAAWDPRFYGDRAFLVWKDSLDDADRIGPVEIQVMKELSGY